MTNELRMEGERLALAAYKVPDAEHLSEFREWATPERILELTRLAEEVGFALAEWKKRLTHLPKKKDEILEVCAEIAEEIGELEK